MQPNVANSPCKPNPNTALLQAQKEWNQPDTSPQAPEYFVTVLGSLLSVLEAWKRATALQITGTSGSGEDQLLTQGEQVSQVQIHWYLERKKIKLINRFFCPMLITGDFQVIHVKQQKALEKDFNHLRQNAGFWLHRFPDPTAYWSIWRLLWFTSAPSAPLRTTSLQTSKWTELHAASHIHPLGLSCVTSAKAGSPWPSSNLLLPATTLRFHWQVVGVWAWGWPWKVTARSRRSTQHRKPGGAGLQSGPQSFTRKGFF